MSKPIVTSDRAELQIIEIDTWWREHRDKAPDLFEEEVAEVSRLIGSAPRVGKRVPHPTEDVRRVIMRKTPGITCTTSSGSSTCSWSRSRISKVCD